MDQFHHPAFAFNQAQNPRFHQLQQQQQPFPAGSAHGQPVPQHSSTGTNVFPNFQGSHAGDFGGYSGAQPQLMQQQRLPGQQQQFFTSPPSSSPIPTSASSAPQQIAPPQSTTTPNQHVSPYGGTPQNTQQTPTSNAPKPQMASPATSQPQAQAQPVATGGAGSPLPPELIEQEKERVSVLLEINQVILHELVAMQKQGKGGNVSQPKPGTTPPEGTKIAAPEYVDCMRCMQANLAYLAADADRHHKKQKMLPGPAVMIPPATNNAEITALYKKLQSLFPGWKGNYDPKAAQNARTSQSPVATTSSAPNPQRSGSQATEGVTAKADS